MPPQPTLVIHDVDLSQFSFNFSQVLKNSELKKLFHQYLETEFNAEPLLFLEAVQGLEGLDENEARQQAQQIITKFVGENAPSEINLSSPAKQQLLQDFQSGNVLVVKVFEKAKDVITLELKTDSFPRFIRSSLWFNFLRKQDKNFITQLGVPKAATIYDYTDDDFGKNAIVTDYDFVFAEQMLQDNYGWELITHLKHKNSVCNAFFCAQKNFLPNVSWAKKVSP
jgi:hypothetical protein